jgi:hypothetical protein
MVLPAFRCKQEWQQNSNALGIALVFAAKPQQLHCEQAPATPAASRLSVCAAAELTTCSNAQQAWRQPLQQKHW